MQELVHQVCGAEPLQQDEVMKRILRRKKSCVCVMSGYQHVRVLERNIFVFSVLERNVFVFIVSVAKS